MSTTLCIHIISCSHIALQKVIMMMMSGFLECIINSPQTCHQSAKQVGLQMSNKGREGRVADHRAAG